MGVGSIRFDNVDFSVDLWCGLSFSVEPGETVAIVGATGAGKTSIINILMRFCGSRRGRSRSMAAICSSLATTDLRRDIALVMQDIFLFRGTIMDNITPWR